MNLDAKHSIELKKTFEKIITNEIVEDINYIQKSH